MESEFKSEKRFPKAKSKCIHYVISTICELGVPIEAMTCVGKVGHYGYCQACMYLHDMALIDMYNMNDTNKCTSVAN